MLNKKAMSLSASVEVPRSKPFVVMPPILLAVLAVFLSLAWLMPHHTRPWIAFYVDTIAGVVLLTVALWVLARSPGKLELVGQGLLFLALATVPWLQFALGVVYSSGTAWINALYLVGFSLALFVGWHWEKLTPGQCLDFLFLAVVLAAVVSVGMQLMQWLQQTSGSEWVVGSGTSRFYANMGQPNQLASLLLLAVLGVAWAYVRQTLGAASALLLVLYLLIGVTLTESRTAWLNVAAVLAGLNFFWGASRPRCLTRFLLGIGLYFIALHVSLPLVNDWLFGESVVPRELADPIRLAMWKSLVPAITDRPWLGYGWGQITAAVFAAPDFPDIGSMTKHSHNLVLDLLLYNGLILGGMVLLVLAVTFRRFVACLEREYFIIPLLAIGVLLVHAMLELPLHYAYFLLPCGMILGVLLRRAEAKVWLSCSRPFGLVFALAVAGALVITVSDCLEAERTYFNVYFGKKGVAVPPEMQPKLIGLAQWRDRLVFANEIPGGELSPEKYGRMKGVVVTTPETFLMLAFAQNLALNDRPEEARAWLEIMCKVAATGLISGLEEQWAAVADNQAAYSAVDWRHCSPRGVAAK